MLENFEKEVKGSFTRRIKMDKNKPSGLNVLAGGIVAITVLAAFSCYLGFTAFMIAKGITLAIP